MKKSEGGREGAEEEDQDVDEEEEGLKEAATNMAVSDSKQTIKLSSPVQLSRVPAGASCGKEFRREKRRRKETFTFIRIARCYSVWCSWLRVQGSSLYGSDELVMKRLDGARARRCRAVFEDEQTVFLCSEPFLVVPGLVDVALDVKGARNFLFPLFRIEEVEGRLFEGRRCHQP